MELAKKVSDQSQVEKITNIIDDLIGAEEEVRQAEYNSEQLRIQRYESDHERYQANVDSAAKNLLELQGVRNKLGLRNTTLDTVGKKMRTAKR